MDKKSCPGNHLYPRRMHPGARKPKPDSANCFVDRTPHKCHRKAATKDIYESDRRVGPPSARRLSLNPPGCKIKQLSGFDLLPASLPLSRLPT